MLAGWYLTHRQRKIWHYFREDATKSICGSTYAFEARDGERNDRISSFTLSLAGHCHKCVKTRQPEEA